jgi:hypothetical protein
MFSLSSVFATRIVDILEATPTVSDGSIPIVVVLLCRLSPWKAVWRSLFLPRCDRNRLVALWLHRTARCVIVCMWLSAGVFDSGLGGRDTIALVICRMCSFAVVVRRDWHSISRFFISRSTSVYRVSYSSLVSCVASQMLPFDDRVCICREGAITAIVPCDRIRLPS